MRVILFTKMNCRLCDAIKYELLDLQTEYEFALQEEFVETDQDVREGEETPVPFIHMERDGQDILRFEFPVRQAELRRAIHIEMKRRSDRKG
ncbi:MAG: glutaredoxin family protein [Caldilineaceae bacterium]|nr:glutaredoxin family protein [Caldilineaceae bacterium]